MKTSTRITALAGVTALVAAPLGFVTMAPASADADRQGTCGAGSYEFSVDRERSGYDVDANIDNVKPGSKWTFVVSQNGKRVTKVTRTADNEGEVDIDTFAKNKAGKDKIAFTATSGATTCGSSVTVA